MITEALYVIRRSDGAFVARGGRGRTRRLQDAQTYRSREAALGESDRKSETVQRVDDLLCEPRDAAPRLRVAVIERTTPSA